MFTKENIKQIEYQGLTIEEIETQINDFQKGFPPMQLIAAASPQNGVTILSEDEETRYISTFGNSLSSGLDTIKFVPASGAASRMFKALYEYIETGVETEFISHFAENIEKFAFYKELRSKTDSTQTKELIKTLLSDDGLGYGNKPKGLLLFHKYNGTARTPFEEHLVEAASYCAGSKGTAGLHFTISPEHEKGFTELFNKIKSDYEKRFGIKFKVSFSFQHPSTDTIAVDMENKPALDSNGNLIFRPGGHGALLRNLNELDADMIFIKNIDNVTPDRLKPETKRYKKAIAGLLVNLRNKVFSYLEKLEKPESANEEELLKNIETFIRKELFIQFDNQFTNNEEKIIFFKTKLDRPIRICGMVRNQGEPGGGPFWAKNPDGTVSLQIVEKAQIDLNDPHQVELLNQSTHFNPVDIICTTKNYKGKKFNLPDFLDPQTGFISIKSVQGEEIKALELPGLWNGAMSNWNTVFVEVPAETFTPVKTVNDLLRPEHQN
jgi:hypothetical protein